MFTQECGSKTEGEIKRTKGDAEVDGIESTESKLNCGERSRKTRKKRKENDGC